MRLNSVLHVTDRLYRTLLQLYPPRFRARFAAEMAQVFRDSCREAYRQGGEVGVIRRWLESVLDLIVSVLDEHSQENFQMARTTLVRALALAGLVGGALWVAVGVMLLLKPSSGSDFVGSYLEFRSLLTMGSGFGAAGLFGLYLHTAREWPARARVMLLLAAAGGLWAFTASFFTTNIWIMLAGSLTQAAGTVLAGAVLWPQSTTRTWAILFFVHAAAMVLFVAAGGIFAIVVCARLLGESLDPDTQAPLAQ